MVTEDPSYLDVQAAIGITKHNGGYQASERLLAMCHAAQANEVLYVGSGIGVGPVHLARRYGHRVVAADISDEMLEWTRRRARRDGVADRVEAARGDVCDLPFASGRFDLVVVESVLAFVEDKQQAIAECARVTSPGGWVGMNEAVWRGEQPQGRLAVDANVLGTWLPTQAQWRDLWRDSGLVDQGFELHGISMGEEVRTRLQWIGWRWLIPAWGRAIRLVATDPGVRSSIREQLSYPPELAALMGYVLSSGRRPWEVPRPGGVGRASARRP